MEIFFKNYCSSKFYNVLFLFTRYCPHGAFESHLVTVFEAFYLAECLCQPDQSITSLKIVKVELKMSLKLCYRSVYQYIHLLISPAFNNSTSLPIFLSLYLNFGLSPLSLNPCFAQHLSFLNLQSVSPTIFQSPNFYISPSKYFYDNRKKSTIQLVKGMKLVF